MTNEEMAEKLDRMSEYHFGDEMNTLKAGAKALRYMEAAELTGAIKALEFVVRWADDHIRAGCSPLEALQRNEVFLCELRAQLAAQPPAVDRERRLREALEKALDRLSRDAEDVEYVDTCSHCGDEAIDHINSEEWKFDSHGDMLCRECGGHRGLCGYSSGGRNEVQMILTAALADQPPPDQREAAEVIPGTLDALAALGAQRDPREAALDAAEKALALLLPWALQAGANAEDAIGLIRAARGKA